MGTNIWIPLRIAAALLVFINLSSSQSFPRRPPIYRRSYLPGPQYCPNTGGTICDNVDFYPMDEINYVINFTEARYFRLSSLFVNDQQGDSFPNEDKILIRPMPYVPSTHARRQTPPVNYATTRRPTYQGNTRGFRPVAPQSPVGETWHSVTASYGPVAMPAPSSEVRGQVGPHYGQPPQRPVIRPARPEMQQAPHQGPPVTGPARRPVLEEIPQRRPIATLPSSDQDRRIEQGQRFGQRVRPQTHGLVAQPRSEEFYFEMEDPDSSGELPMTPLDAEGSGEMQGNKTVESAVKSKRSPGDIVPLCRSKQIYVQPRAGLNEESEWKYIINNPNRYPSYRQVIKTEICDFRDTSCSSELHFPLGMTGQCRQKYLKRKMLTLSVDGNNISQEHIFIPSCCACEIMEPERK